MKTKPMAHQKEGLKRLTEHPAYYALGAEQGTGKTWMLLADAERQFIDGNITGLLVIAPRGVHINWVRREVPVHLQVASRAWAWESAKTQRRAKALERLLRTDESQLLPIFTINVDAMNTKDGMAAAMKFVTRFRCMVAIDESQRIKNPAAQRTKRVHDLAPLAVSRRILSGTLVANSPIDLFSQYHFLRPGLLGTTSYRAFVAEYAELLPRGHPLMSRLRGNPQIIKRDSDGQPVYKNLERLGKLLAPHTYRVLKKDCIDLPPKIYKTHYFALSAEQQARYNQLKDELMFERPTGEIDVFTALTILTKLRQLTSGYMLVEGEPVKMADESRMTALLECLEDVDGQVIIWAVYREEIRRIVSELPDCVEYHGGVSESGREDAVDAFQRGDKRFFVANPASGGTGLTLTAAQTAVYYSNPFSLEQRLQSEDRCHRIGTTGEHVDYIDLVAVGTIDERVTAALQAKQEIATQILDGL